MRPLFILGFALAALVAVPLAAEAGVITQSRDFRELSFTSRTGPADQIISTDFSFAAFDPAQGRLERVELQLDGFVAFTGSFTCLNSISGACRDTEAVSSLNLEEDGDVVQIARLTIPLLSELPIGSSGSGGLAGTSGDFSIAAHEDVDFDVLFDDPADFLSGPVTLGIISRAFFVAGTGVIRFDRLDRHEVAGRATLSYFFEEAQPPVVAVAAPTSLPILAAGLAVFGFAARRKGSHASS